MKVKNKEACVKDRPPDWPQIWTVVSLINIKEFISRQPVNFFHLQLVKYLAISHADLCNMSIFFCMWATREGETL